MMVTFSDTANNVIERRPSRFRRLRWRGRILAWGILMMDGLHDEWI